MITDNPIADFLRHDQKMTKWLEGLPKCDICGEPIQDDHAYLINGDVVCRDCLDEIYKIEIYS